MTLYEYIKQAKKELDAFAERFIEGNKIDPDMWPIEMKEEEWGEQEMASRFGG